MSTCRLLFCCLLVSLCAGLSSQTFAQKTLTIKGAGDEVGDVIQLPALPQQDVAVRVNEEGIVIDIPFLDLRTRCLGTVENGYCVIAAAAGGVDSDGDGVPDAIDDCNVNPQGQPTFADGCTADQRDDDNDGVANGVDNCPNNANPSQTDADNDGIGDACDNNNDSDGDGVGDAVDNCPNNANASQADADGDGIGDACDTLTDSDGDGVADSQDNCVNVANPGQEDADGNGVGDACQTASSAYCANAPSFVSCSSSFTWDDWYAGVGDRQFTIPASGVLSVPFTTSNTNTGYGTSRYKEAEGVPQNFRWRKWYSATPGGTPLANASGVCDVRLSTTEITLDWTQDPTRANRGCFLGSTESVLYANYELVEVGTTNRFGSAWVFIGRNISSTP